jgi:hypothetical protein
MALEALVEMQRGMKITKSLSVAVFNSRGTNEAFSYVYLPATFIFQSRSDIAQHHEELENQVIMLQCWACR